MEQGRGRRRGRFLGSARVKNEHVSAQIHDVATQVGTWITRPVLSSDLAIRRDHGGFRFGLVVVLATAEASCYCDCG